MVFPDTVRLVLASGSPYRKALLDQVGLACVVCPPDIDEAAWPAESPAATATRLAAAKARAVAPRFPNGVIIGSDQVATADGITSFSKPGNHANAVAQLTHMSGRTVHFHTAVSVLNARTGAQRGALVTTEVTYRDLPPEDIERYLVLDRPYDCAGSARIEGKGIALVRRVAAEDPTALLGLPLIALLDLLAAEGIRVL